jgi:hypothetical protein
MQCWVVKIDLDFTGGLYQLLCLPVFRKIDSLMLRLGLQFVW